ncbi:MAG: hypothetical protein V3S20_03020 [Dehalococcoidia bacterium]
MTVVVAGAGLILAAILGWAVASGWLGGSSEPEATALVSPTPVSPTPSSEVPTGGAAATAAATPSRASRGGSPGPNTSGETALLYSEFGESEDTLWLTPVSQLQEPEAVATIAHAPFWGISASLSPDGRQVAYVVLPPSVPNPEEDADDQAELWVQPVGGGEPRFLAQNADVSEVPVWSPDSRALAFQSFDRRRNLLTLLRARLRDGAVSVLARIDGATAVFPLAFSPGGDRFYVAQTSEGGTELLAIDTAEGSVETAAKVVGDVVRGWHSSPDGLGLTFVSRIGGQEWGLHIVSLVDGTVSRLESQAIPSGRELFSPVWHPQQPLLTVGTAPDGGGGVINVPLSGQNGERLAGPDDGFDVPLAWAPSGDYLVVQQFSEYPVQRRPSIDVLTSSGERQGLAQGMEVTFIGWLASAE